MAIIEDKILPLAGKIGTQRHLKAIRDGIVLTMPLIVIGSIFLILAYLPINSYTNFMNTTFGDDWVAKLSYPVGASFNIMSLVTVFGIAYHLANSYKVEPLGAGAIALSTFLLVTPYNVPLTLNSGETVIASGIPLSASGSQGLFVALIIGLLSTEIYRFCIQKNWTIKMPAGVPSAVSKSFSALIPGFFAIVIFWVIRLLIEQTSFESIHTIIKEILQEPLSNLTGSLAGIIVIVLLIHLFWAVGIHGANVVGAVVSPILLSAMGANLEAYQAGTPLPEIVTQQFIDIFVFIGGSGSTLALVVAMMFVAKSKQAKTLSKLSLPAGLFNINEPIIFGMPIVLNPLLLIPFLLTPVVLVITSYLAINWGWVPRLPGIAVPWTMPPIFGGWLVTGGSFSGVVLQLVNFVIAFFIYLPFLKAWDKLNLKQEQG